MVVAAPADQDARDRVQRDLSATLFVEAGAGTGKTRELVERVVRLVASGSSELRHIAAITFTEAAAAELRDRVRLRLEESARDVELPAEEHVRCQAALDQVDAAAIETLHAFAQRILADHPLEAGLPPLIEVQDEIRALIGFDERWAAFVDELLADRELEDTLLRGFTLGLKLDELRTLAWELHQHWDRLEGAAIAVLGADPVDVELVVAALDGACGAMPHCTDHDDRLYQQLERVDAYRGRLRAAQDGLDCLRALAERRPLTTNAGRKEAWLRISPNEVRQKLALAQQLRDTLVSSQRAAVLSALLARLQRFVLQYADERRMQGRLEFHDLLVQARDLLRRDASVRAAVRERYHYILIDEFQDTDPLQIQIAALIAGEDAGAQPPPWEQAAFTPGRIFFVGDPKQSVYRFRRADIDLYLRAQRRFEDGAVRLRQNFRSVPSVIDWVNAVFDDLIGAEPPDGQAPYVHLEASRPALDGALAVRALGAPADEKLEKLRPREAVEIARVIASIKRDGWLVAGQGPDGERQARPARYADIALLMPTRTTLPPIEDALETAGIPYRVESRSLVYDTQEVRDLLAVLRAIDDPTDQVALVAALRAPAFGCADDDLLRFSQAGGAWDYRRDPPEALDEHDPVVGALRSLHALHQRRWWDTISGLVEAVIRERRLFELAFATRRPRERWQRLRFVLDQSRAFAEAGGRTLRQFIDWAERQKEEGTRVVETVVPEPDDDAVRIMTIHAAKGLEFPIVLLAGLNVEARLQGRFRRPVLWDEDRPEARIGPFETPGYEPLLAREEELERHEKTRLLYVAATRACDHLVVSLHHKQGPTSLAQPLFVACMKVPHLWQHLTPREVPPVQQALPEPASFDDAPQRRSAWLTERDAQIERFARVPAYAATEIAGRASVSEDASLRKDAPEEEAPPWRRGRAGTAHGRAVHAVLQSIDLATGEGLEGAARAQAAAEGIPGRARDVARAVESALRSDAVREAVASGRYWREVYVGAPAEGVVLEGFIDLLYETPDGLVVVDYKTDRVPSDDDLDAAIARYRLQGTAYALALQETLGRPVVRCVFVFAAPDGARERAVADLPQAVGDVRAALRRAAPA